MTAALHTSNLRPVLVRLFAATLLCSAVAVPSAVLALDEAPVSQRSVESSPGSEWPIAGK
ncbi:hypothetical protein [Streptomyces oceani]|uniref:Uncharacterized protein n=1 Tax=Streptomyces oceani TaxID=1075402 RepID=A0A1E7KNN2_9ACTN|nr:hypothetical protein [Streptomyces oceani]OEV05579.1 hypothetical protein AN216_02660 [Streptomyces oceani]